MGCIKAELLELIDCRTTGLNGFKSSAGTDTFIIATGILLNILPK
jgi:hypothetical protein